MNNIRRLPAMHRYYRITRFYEFLKHTSLKGGLSILFFVLLIIAFNRYVYDIEALIIQMVENYSKLFVYGLFFVSETLLGVVPPEIFIAWSAKSSSPWVTLFIIATLSYAGGIAAYFIGKQLFKVPKISNYIENKITLHVRNLKIWGGLLVIVGALLPIPHSMVSLACGIINYKFSSYLLWALFRYLRFWVYGLAIFEILN